MKKARLIGTWSVVALALVLAGAAPASAQEEVPLDRARMTQYAKAHMALNDARDEFHGKVGRIHDEQGRERARQEMDTEVAAALEANSMTREQYDAITLLISMDGDARALFDEVMAELATEGTGSS